MTDALFGRTFAEFHLVAGGRHAAVAASGEAAAVSVLSIVFQPSPAHPDQVGNGAGQNIGRERIMPDPPPGNTEGDGMKHPWFVHLADETSNIIQHDSRRLGVPGGQEPGRR